MAVIWQTLFSVPSATQQPGVVVTNPLVIPATAAWIKITFDMAEKERTDSAYSCLYRFEISADDGDTWILGPMQDWAGFGPDEIDIADVNKFGSWGTWAGYITGIPPEWQSALIRGYFDIAERIKAGFTVFWAEADTG